MMSGAAMFLLSLVGIVSYGLGLFYLYSFKKKGLYFLLSGNVLLYSFYFIFLGNIVVAPFTSLVGDCAGFILGVIVSLMYLTSLKEKFS
jgi:hypothetical protein